MERVRPSPFLRTSVWLRARQPLSEHVLNAALVSWFRGTAYRRSFSMWRKHSGQRRMANGGNWNDEDDMDSRAPEQADPVLVHGFHVNRDHADSITGRPTISAAFFRATLERFRGRRVKGGFKEDDPPRGGFGEWVQNESKKLAGRALTPRHGSFIAAILCSEGDVKRDLVGMAVWLEFPK